jgi:hypothetical protein
MMTLAFYANVADGTLKIGPNFWSTTSFEELNLGASIVFMILLWLLLNSCRCSLIHVWKI